MSDQPKSAIVKEGKPGHVPLDIYDIASKRGKHMPLGSSEPVQALPPEAAANEFLESDGTRDWLDRKEPADAHFETIAMPSAPWNRTREGNQGRESFRERFGRLRNRLDNLVADMDTESFMIVHDRVIGRSYLVSNEPQQTASLKITAEVNRKKNPGFDFWVVPNRPHSDPERGYSVSEKGTITINERKAPAPRPSPGANPHYVPLRERSSAWTLSELEVRDNLSEIAYIAARNTVTGSMSYTDPVAQYQVADKLKEVKDQFPLHVVYAVPNYPAQTHTHRVDGKGVVRVYEIGNGVEKLSNPLGPAMVSEAGSFHFLEGKQLDHDTWMEDPRVKAALKANLPASRLPHMPPSHTYEVNSSGIVLVRNEKGELDNPLDLAVRGGINQHYFEDRQSTQAWIDMGIVDAEHTHRISWRNKATGATGYGPPIPQDLAERLVAEMNVLCPDIEHAAYSRKFQPATREEIDDFMAQAGLVRGRFQDEAEDALDDVGFPRFSP